MTLLLIPSNLIGVYRQTKIQTPRLDKMAAEGLIFTQSFNFNKVIVRIYTTFLFLIVSFQIQAQEYYSQNNDQVIINNRLAKRILDFSGDSVKTTFFGLTDESIGVTLPSKDFSFSINDELLSGYSGWELIGTSPIRDSSEGKGVRIDLKAKTFQLEISLNYLLYPDLPLIRKWITFKNTGNSLLKLERLNVEDLDTRLSFIQSVVHHNYGRMKHIGRYVGNWDDPVVVVHDISERNGMALGNEGVAVLKRTAYHTTKNNVEIGLTHPDQSFAFRKYINPGQIWESPKTFVCLYDNRDDGFQVIDQEVNRFVTLYMKTRITTLEEKPVFVYNTWYPFRTQLSDTLVQSVAKAAAECGIVEFVIDDGWQVNQHRQSTIKGWGENYGDWLVDENKFPGGLKPTFDYIKSLGMTPGLWISIASATEDSQVFHEHPEWFVKDKHGNPGNLHYDAKPEDGFYSASFGTDWYEYIKLKILNLVKEHGLQYAKLDLAIVTSPYLNNDEKSGSYAKDHLRYRDHNESFIVLYQRLLDFFDDLHEEDPELFIDCTFETTGKLQLMDYAIAQHAEGNWLSNFEEPSPTGPLRVRQMAWWRSPAIPASSMVIGNQPLDDPNFEFSLKSLVGTFPIVLGDPRKLTSEKRKEIRNWSEWMQKMQDKYDYMSYRRDLAGFGEPKEGHWDGWQRINFKTNQGGIFGVFRQGAKEKDRRIFLNDLIPDQAYVIREAPTQKVVLKTNGKALMEDGFSVTIEKSYDGRIFEVGVEDL